MPSSAQGIAVTNCVSSPLDGQEEDLWDFGTVRHVGVNRNTIGRASQPPLVPPIAENGNGAQHSSSPVQSNGVYDHGDRGYQASATSVATASTITLKTEQQPQHPSPQKPSPPPAALDQFAPPPPEYPNRSVNKPLPSPNKRELEATVRHGPGLLGTPTRREPSYDDEDDEEFPGDEAGEPEYESAMLDSVILPAIAAVRVVRCACETPHSLNFAADTPSEHC